MSARRRFAVGLSCCVASLYTTIWLHEIGHAVSAYLFGCKANWWQTDTSWYLVSSWGGDIDYACLRERGNAALGWTEFGGVAVNLVLLALSPVLGAWWRTPAIGAWRPWYLFTFLLALSNYAEAFSYLVVNTAWLKSDMVGAVSASGVGRWWWCGIGLGLAIVTGRLLGPPALQAARTLAGPGGSVTPWRRRFFLYVVVLALVMAVARGALT